MTREGQAKPGGQAEGLATPLSRFEGLDEQVKAAVLLQGEGKVTASGVLMTLETLLNHLSKPLSLTGRDLFLGDLRKVATLVVGAFGGAGRGCGGLAWSAFMVGVLLFCAIGSVIALVAVGRGSFGAGAGSGDGSNLIQFMGQLGRRLLQAPTGAPTVVGVTIAPTSAPTSAQLHCPWHKFTLAWPDGKSATAGSGSRG